jgi:hypothetical protein
MVSAVTDFMKLDLPEDFAVDLGNRLGVIARNLILTELTALKEQELLRELRQSALPDIEKIRRYLANTGNGTTGSIVKVTNEYLYRNLGLSQRRMKIARNQLEASGEIQVSCGGYGAFNIRHTRSR